MLTMELSYSEKQTLIRILDYKVNAIRAWKERLDDNEKDLEYDDLVSILRKLKVGERGQLCLKKKRL